MNISVWVPFILVKSPCKYFPPYCTFEEAIYSIINKLIWHLQIWNFFAIWDGNFFAIYLKFCHNRIDPLGSCFEAWTLVCARWPTVYLPISIPHHFFPTPISFLEVVAVHYFGSFIFIVCSLPFFFWPQYTRTRATHGPCPNI